MSATLATMAQDDTSVTAIPAHQASRQAHCVTTHPHGHSGSTHAHFDSAHLHAIRPTDKLPELRTATRPKVSAVIPAMNEAANLPHVFGALPEIIDEVILVDGHSHDDTVAVARTLRPDVRVVTQTHRGKGNALACGFAVATGEIIVMLDADGSTDPAEIPAFVAALVAGADLPRARATWTAGVLMI